MKKIIAILFLMFFAACGQNDHFYRVTGPTGVAGQNGTNGTGIPVVTTMPPNPQPGDEWIMYVPGHDFTQFSGTVNIDGGNGTLTISVLPANEPANDYVGFQTNCDGIESNQTFCNVDRSCLGTIDSSYLTEAMSLIPVNDLASCSRWYNGIVGTCDYCAYTVVTIVPTMYDAFDIGYGEHNFNDIVAHINQLPGFTATLSDSSDGVLVPTSNQQGVYLQSDEVQESLTLYVVAADGALWGQPLTWYSPVYMPGGWK